MLFTLHRKKPLRKPRNIRTIEVDRVDWKALKAGKSTRKLPQKDVEGITDGAIVRVQPRFETSKQWTLAILHRGPMKGPSLSK